MKTPPSSLRLSFRKRLALGLTAICALAMMLSVVKSDDVPGLRLQLLSSNQFQLTVTNGVATNNYEIYRRLAFDPLYPWNLHLMGTNGQTNFTASMGIDTTGFFQARAGNDSDGDGVPNWKDADPYNSGVGVLTINIDTPAHGANLP